MFPTPLLYEFCAAAACPTHGPGVRGAVLIDETGAIWVPNSSGGHVKAISAEQAGALNSGNILASDGGLLALSEATPYYTAAGVGSYGAFVGACELAGWYCSVAAGNITIYDALSATGTPIVPATALAVGPTPIFGAGTNSRLILTTGCYVVLSGAATVRVAVGG